MKARSEPLLVARRLEREPGELDPERRRLGVDPVGAPDTQRVARGRGPACRQRVHEVRASGQDDVGDRLQLEGQAGVEDVARGEPVMDPAPGRAGGLGEDVDERRRVMVGDLLALVDCVDRERGVADRLELLGGRAVHLLAGGDLDLAHRLEAGMVGPDLGHRGPRVALDHCGGLSATSASDRDHARGAEAARPPICRSQRRDDDDRHLAGAAERVQRIGLYPALHGDRPAAGDRDVGEHHPQSPGEPAAGGPVGSAW